MKKNRENLSFADDNLGQIFLEAAEITEEPKKVSKKSLTESKIRVPVKHGKKITEGRKELARSIRSGDLERDAEYDELYGDLGDGNTESNYNKESDGWHVQFQDRASAYHYPHGKGYEKHPRITSHTWGRAWKDGKIVKTIDGSKYGARQEMAKWLDSENESFNTRRRLKEEFVQVSDEDIETFLNKIEKSGFELDKSIRHQNPIHGMFGSLHFQIINPVDFVGNTEQTFDEMLFREVARDCVKCIEVFENECGYSCTWSFGVNEDGFVTAGVDVRNGLRESFDEVSYDKKSKKAQREEDAKKRGEMMPAPKTFKDRKKEADKKASRGRVREEESYRRHLRESQEDVDVQAYKEAVHAFDRANEILEGANADIVDNIKSLFEEYGGRVGFRTVSSSYIAFNSRIGDYSMTNSISMDSLYADVRRFAEDFATAVYRKNGGDFFGILETPRMLRQALRDPSIVNVRI